MTNKMVNCSRIKSVQGDIFNIDENLYDAVIVFVAGGFTGINTNYRLNKEKIRNSHLPYLIYSDKKIDNNSKFYNSHREFFNSEEEIREYIDKVVCSTLDYAYSFGNRIATSGMWIRGLDQIKNETWMVESIFRWLSRNPEAQITIVDIADNINKHRILN